MPAPVELPYLAQDRSTHAINDRLRLGNVRRTLARRAEVHRAVAKMWVYVWETTDRGGLLWVELSEPARVSLIFFRHVKCVRSCESLV